MKVKLAGFNIESEMIESLKGDSRECCTPEVISAAYARISRDPRSVDRLRREARNEVEAARRSNRKIVFGMGHSSIAEHAMFNFDIMDVSRLAVEELEHFRLASFTEKSQRYIKLGRDLLIPVEIEEAGLGEEFRSMVTTLHREYRKLLDRIMEVSEQEGVAREDSRYVMPLATTAQLGMTVNARELEYIIGRLSSHPLDELRQLSRQLSELAGKVAPSLIRYTETSPYLRNVYQAKTRLAGELPLSESGDGGRERPVELLDYTRDADRRLSAAILFSAGDISMEDAQRIAEDMNEQDKKYLILETMAGLESYHSVWREFECVGFTFQVVVSASCFAQLKRHRMSTQIPQDYLTSLGVSVPPGINRSGSTDFFNRCIDISEGMHRRLEELNGQVSSYALTNSHRRRVLVEMNLREIYHFSRLRSDHHAQWEIRNLSDEICRLVKEKAPLGAMLLGGKDSFERIRRTAGESPPHDKDK